jgi:hypothetical protein
MPSLSANISNGCALGAGVLTLTSVTSAAPLGSTYEWVVRDKAATDYGSVFDPSELPVYASSLPNGTYTSVVTATDPATQITYNSRTFTFTVSCKQCDLVLHEVVGKAPSAAGQSGSIEFKTSSSNGPVAVMATLVADSTSGFGAVVLGDDSPQSLTTNLAPGDYQLSATDQAGCVQQAYVTVPAYAKPPVLGCTDPAADNYDPDATQDDGSCAYTPPVRAPWFEVPPMQSLRFVQPNRADKPAFDNTLLHDEQPLDYLNPGYCQLVEQGDTLVIQVQSNYALPPVLEIRRCADDAVIKTVTASKVLQGAGQTAAFDMYAKPDQAAGFTRLYFNADALPLPFLLGQRVTISATGTALDGTYPLHDVLEDAAAAVPYLRILKAYPSGMLRTDGTLTTAYVVQKFDTYQAVLPFGAVPMGCYYAQASASDPDFASALAVSEPIDVAPQHVGSLLLAYRNFDNANGHYYGSGLVNRLRFTGRFFRRKPTTEKDVLRNDDRELVLLRAGTYRKVELETLQLPDWLHEVLTVAFTSDFTKLEGVEVILEGDYTFEPVERYTLGKGTALLEVKHFLGAGNRDDLGDMDKGGGPFLVANDTFLLARP